MKITLVFEGVNRKTGQLSVHIDVWNETERVALILPNSYAFDTHKAFDEVQAYFKNLEFGPDALLETENV